MVAFPLLRARRERGLSQAQLAKRAKIGIQTISRIERGHTIPSIETMIALAKALKVSLDTLVER